MPSLTIYTITYNRENLLARLYESIVNASEYFPIEFEWLVINNGSTDATDQLLAELKRKSKVEIRIHTIAENIGFTRADNIARELNKLSYSSRIDDDDMLKKDYFELFINNEPLIRNADNICGLMFNCEDENGGLIGLPFRYGNQLSNDYDLYHKMGIFGDKVRIYKSTIRDNYFSPTFDGELLSPTELVYNRMGEEYLHACINKVAIIREYCEGGITKGQETEDARTNINGILLNLYELINNPNASPLERLKFRLKFLRRCFLAKMNYDEVRNKIKDDRVLFSLNIICNIFLIPTLIIRKKSRYFSAD